MTANRNFHPHDTRISQHSPTICSDDPFIIANTAILQSTTTDNFAIIHGASNMDEVFPSTGTISHTTTRQEIDDVIPKDVTRPTAQVPSND
jgi:hypothetical protein